MLPVKGLPAVVDANAVGSGENGEYSGDRKARQNLEVLGPVCAGREKCEQSPQEARGQDPPSGVHDHPRREDDEGDSGLSHFSGDRRPGDGHGAEKQQNQRKQQGVAEVGREPHTPNDAGHDGHDQGRKGCREEGVSSRRPRPQEELVNGEEAIECRQA